MSSGRTRVAGPAHLRNIGPTPQVTPAQTRYKLWEVSNRRMGYRMADRNPSRSDWGERGETANRNRARPPSGDRVIQ